MTEFDTADWVERFEALGLQIYAMHGWKREGDDWVPVHKSNCEVDGGEATDLFTELNSANTEADVETRDALVEDLVKSGRHIYLPKVRNHGYMAKARAR